MHLLVVHDGVTRRSPFAAMVHADVGVGAAVVVGAVVVGAGVAPDAGAATHW